MSMADETRIPENEALVTASGRIVSDAEIEALADEAERGYDLATGKPNPVTVTRNGLLVRVTIEDTDSGPLLRLDGLNCNLEGQAPGEYLLTPATVMRPPEGFWRPVPCGHPPDPVAWLDSEGRAICHCGSYLTPALAFRNVPTPEGMAGFDQCGQCGCFVAIPTPF